MTPWIPPLARSRLGAGGRLDVAARFLHDLPPVAPGVALGVGGVDLVPDHMRKCRLVQVPALRPFPGTRS
ncbi:MAG: hypothetical protein OXG81_02745 [Acidobacteria bacterium]|nr:hypothetical protein [Acidobacteriota bacterium]